MIIIIIFGPKKLNYVINASLLGLIGGLNLLLKVWDLFSKPIGDIAMLNTRHFSRILHPVPIS